MVTVVCEVRVMKSSLLKREEVVKCKMKCSKAARVDGIAFEFIKRVGKDYHGMNGSW